MRLHEERTAIVDACRELVATGLVRGTSGNVSVRDPASGLVALTPSGTRYDSMTAGDIAVVDAGGRVMEGPVEPTTEIALHLAVYRARADVHAVVHTHSPFATTFAALGEPVPAVHYLLARAASEVRVAPYARYGTPELAAACVAMLGADHGVLLASHGVVAVGADLPAAMAVAEAIEATAEIAWRARAIGQPRVLPGEEIAGVAADFTRYGRTLRRGAAGTAVRAAGSSQRREGAGVDDKDVLGRISALVDEEHDLRGIRGHTDEQRARMNEVEAQLDQCWDLLRQRRAKQQYGENPDEAHTRPENQVEGYLQ